MPAETLIPYDRVRDVSGVFEATAAFIRANARVLTVSLLCIVAPVSGVSAIFATFLQQAMLEMDPEALLQSPALMRRYLLVLGFVVLSTAMSMSVVFATMHLYRDQGPETFGLNEVWSRALRLIAPMLGMLMALVGLFVLSSIVAVIPCLGVLLYLGGAVYYGVIATLLFPMRAFESVDLLTAFRRAVALARGQWLATLGVLFITGLVVFLLGLVFRAPAFLLIVGSEAAGLAPAVARLLLMAAGLLSGAVSALLSALPLTALAFHYFSLRTQHEAAEAS